MKADKQYPFVISSLTEEDNIVALNDIRLAIQPSMQADYKAFKQSRGFSDGVKLASDIFDILRTGEPSLYVAADGPGIIALGDSYISVTSQLGVLECPNAVALIHYFTGLKLTRPLLNNIGKGLFFGIFRPDKKTVKRLAKKNQKLVFDRTGVVDIFRVEDEEDIIPDTHSRGADFGSTSLLSRQVGNPNATQQEQDDKRNKDSEFPIERLGLEEGNVTMAMRRLHDKIVSDSGEENPLGLIIGGVGHYSAIMRTLAPRPDFPEIVSDKACEYVLAKLDSEECEACGVSEIPWREWFSLAVELGDDIHRRGLEKAQWRNEARLERITESYNNLTEDIVGSVMNEEAENNPYSSLALFGVERLDDLIKTSTLYPRDLKNLDSPPNSTVGLRENVELMKFLTQHLKQAKRREALLEAAYCCASGCCLDPGFLLRIKTIRLKGGLALDLLLTKEANIFWSPEKETELSEAMDEFLGTLDGLVANYEASKVRYPTLGKK